MRKIGHTGRYLQILSYMAAALLAFQTPCSVLAAELEMDETDIDASETSDAAEPEVSVRYITSFEALAEEEAYFPCMYKPSLEELSGVFPETLLAWLEGEEEPAELAVVWECEEDFDATAQPYYLFYPKWDETQYAVAESVKDSIEIPVITVEVPQGGGSILNPEEAKNSLYQLIQKKAVLASVYLCDEYEVKAEPFYDSETIHAAASGQSVQITDVESDTYGGIWYRVLFYQSGTEYTGYVERAYLATSDENFASWEENWLDLSAVPAVMELSEGCPDIDQFPASYQNALYALKEKHPDWIFARMDTGLDWNTVIANELGDKSWIPSSRSGSWQNGNTSQRGWSYASEGILKYYMDPRNFLDDSHIFQFEQLTYNSSYHTTDAVQEILTGSFMASAIPEDGRTYAQAFTAIGQEIGVSPFHLASRVLQEQGAKGTSALISGTYPGYEGYYNFFNISASGANNTEVIKKGLAKAKAEGWNTRYASLYGGARIIGNQYILGGQNTLYLEKFNVANEKYANYTHQYMQNIEAPYYEAASIYKAYQKAGVLERPFVFKIPVYENMPASACSQPEKTDAVTLDKTSIGSLEVDKSVKLIPYVNGSKVDSVSDMVFTSSNTSVAVVDAQGKVTALSPGDVTITCSRSRASSADCTITVVKGNPAVSTPVLSPVTYREGIQLSDVVLPDGWAWKNGETAIAVGTPSYAAVFTPEDITKYNPVTKNISFTVTKGIPSCQVPAGLEVKSGDVLGSIVLPEGFSWESDVETVLTDSGEYTFYVFYNPDENNYHSVNHIPIIVQVKETVQEKPSGGTGNSGGSGTGGGTGSGTGTGGGSGSGTGTGGGSGTGSGTGTGTGGGAGSGTGAGTDSGAGTGGGAGSGNSGTGSENNNGNDGSGSSTGDGNNNSSSGSESSTGSGNGNGSSGSSGTGSAEGTGNGSSNSSSGSESGTGSGNGSGSTGSGAGNAGGSGSSAGSGTGASTGSNGNQPPPVTAGNTQPPSSTGNTAAGNNQPPASAGSATTGNNQPPSSAGSSQPSESAGNNQPSESAGSTAAGSSQPSAPAGNTAAGSSQPPASAGSNQPSVSTGNVQAGNISPENTAAGNGQPGNSAGSSSANGAESSATAGKQQLSTEQNGTAEGSENSAAAENAEKSGQTEPSEESGYFRPAVTIPMEDTTILTAEKMQMAKEQGFDLLLDMGGAVAWSIDVDSIGENAMTEVDMGVTVGTDHVPQELISTILNGNKYLEITLAHQGNFGFEAVLQIALGKEYSGKYANLFYYDPEEETLEFICDAVIGPDGVASLCFEHASCYLIIVSDESMSGVSFEDESVNHVTRWIIAGVFICMLLVVLGYGVFFFLKNKRDEDEEEDKDEAYDEEEEQYEEYEAEEMGALQEGYEPEKAGAPYRKNESGETDEPYGKNKSKEEDEKPVRRFRTFDLKSAEADKKHKAEASGQRGMCDLESEDEGYSDEDDWIEDEDWLEPEPDTKTSGNASANDRMEDDWPEEDDWNAEDDWIEDDEWEE